MKIFSVSKIDVFRDLVIENDHISRMEKSLREAIDKGLDKESHKTATVKCFPTYVRELPSGFEVRNYLVFQYLTQLVEGVLTNK